MIFIKNKITDVYFNLAMEEYIFEKFKSKIDFIQLFIYFSEFHVKIINAIFIIDNKILYSKTTISSSLIYLPDCTSIIIKGILPGLDNLCFTPIGI